MVAVTEPETAETTEPISVALVKSPVSSDNITVNAFVPV